MDLRFLPGEPARLDEANVELCACPVWSDERPMRGFGAVVDWRLGGRLSALLRSGFFRGDAAEALLVPGKPHVPFEKVLLIGLGPRLGFDDERFRGAILHVARTLEGLRIRRTVLELPGRGSGAIDPERAITVALECVGSSPLHDLWWIVDDLDAHKRIQLRAADERRRVRTP